MVSLHYAVSDTGFADNRDACLGQGGDVPIDGADTRSELFSNILGAGNPAPLHIDKDSDKSIDAIHQSYYNTGSSRLE
jgi:hypothetical protein